MPRRRVSPYGGFICRSWLLLGPPPPSWAVSAKMTQTEAVFLSKPPKLNSAQISPSQLNSAGLPATPNLPHLYAERPSPFLGSLLRRGSSRLVSHEHIATFLWLCHKFWKTSLVGIVLTGCPSGINCPLSICKRHPSPHAQSCVWVLRPIPPSSLPPWLWPLANQSPGDGTWPKTHQRDSG